MKAVAALALLGLGGCGTITDLTETPRIYGGVRQDVDWLGERCMAGVGLLDLPLSAVLDTALLPATIVIELVR